MRNDRPNLANWPSIAVTVGVLWRIILIAGFVWLASVLWPSSPEWWALGLYAILLYLGAIVMGFVAVRMTVEEAIRLWRVRRFRGDARTARADRLAGDEDLDHGGLL